jgi:uncharacterized protein involved in exopolysaccharide biosynthesis
MGCRIAWWLMVAGFLGTGAVLLVALFRTVPTVGA